jgi:hypothetical protein
LDESREARHHLASGVILERRADRDERVAEGLVAGEHLHRRPGTRVGRSEHQHARAVHRHHLLPHRGLFQQHRAREQAAHRMREDPHGLPAALACLEGGLHFRGQAPRLAFQGLAPVVAELEDFMGAREEPAEVVIHAIHRAIGLDAVTPGAVFESLETVDQAPAQPDARIAHLQVAAEDAREHENRGLLARGLAVVGRARTHAGGALAGP